MHIQSVPLLRYPRTAHLQGSRLQEGDDASDQVPLEELRGKFVVIEEKMDGANTGVSFSEAAELRLQSRGHYLVGGGSERQFALLKKWAVAHEDRLLERLEDRYVMYGETTTGKHSVYYDQMPHHFHEFDLYDRQTGVFLSTRRRHQLLKGSPVLSVPVLYQGPMPSAKALWSLVQRSLAKSPQWRESFDDTVARQGLPRDLCWQQTDKNDLAEGLYLKVENENEVLGRYKLVRSDFVQTILDSGSHHTRRPFFPNRVHQDVDLYSPEPTVTWEDLGLVTLTQADLDAREAGRKRAGGR